MSPLLAKELAVLTKQGISSARAWQAVDAQGKLVHAALANKLARAMGSAFAGTWFEPATAQMHVGVKAGASRRTAEQVIARAGLVANAIITPVRSTMGQLLAVQKMWNRKLASLIAREEATTGLEPQRNAVAVTLGAAVPQSQRVTLAREAAVANVNVFVTVAPDPHLGLRPAAAECNNFNEAAPNANCNPSITAGVQIERPEESTGRGWGTEYKTTTIKEFEKETLVGVFAGDWVRGLGLEPGTQVVAKPTETSVTINKPGSLVISAEFEFFTSATCSAGPAAIPEAHRGRRVLLTAGHCIEAGHGTGSFWYASKRNGEKAQLGAAGEFQYGGAEGEGKGDLGDIAIEPSPGGGWQTGKVNKPVLAVTAEWKKEAETRYKVKGERAAEAGNTNCHEGRTSGEWCGKIEMINATGSWQGKYFEGMVMDEKAIAEPGDSGGPVLFIEPSNEVLMEGTVAAALPVECKENATIKTGPEFFVTKELCLELKERIGTAGLWERKIQMGWQPLRTAPLKIPEGSLEKLKLELLTTANEKVRPRLQNKNAESLSKKTFTSKSGAVTLEAVGGSKITCSAGKENGEATSTSGGTEAFKLTGCEGFSQKCNTSSAAEGELDLNAKYSVVFVKESEELGLLTEFSEASIECGTKCPLMISETVKLRGSAVGVATPVNKEVVPSEVFKVVFSQSKGAQGASEYLNEEGEAVKASIELDGSGSKSFGFEKSGISATDELLFEEAAELEA
ncbi:MAG TPA: hypothetical protein VK730_02725 [Solirubrobacteraceae bacterium]|nr:hypothetical protein [Solirubrobacteraceae bacterium]